MLRFPKFAFTTAQLIAIASLFLQACGVAVKGAPSTCGSGTAQIDVYDTFIMRGCGCLEGAGQSFTGQTLTCTVKVGTKVFFYYPNITNQHLIVLSAGATGTPVYHNPQNHSEANAVDAITLNSTSSTGITFVDQYTTNGGTFFVQ